MRVMLARRRKSKQNQRHDGRRYLDAAIVAAWQISVNIRPAYVRPQIGQLNPHPHVINTTQLSYLSLHHSQVFDRLSWTIKPLQC